jgi:hypothetical protein
MTPMMRTLRACGFVLGIGLVVGLQSPSMVLADGEDDYDWYSLVCVQMIGSEGLEQALPEVYGNDTDPGYLTSQRVWSHTVLGRWDSQSRRIAWNAWESWLYKDVLNYDFRNIGGSAGWTDPKSGLEIPNNVTVWNITRSQAERDWWISYTQIYWPTAAGGWSSRAFFSDWVSC